MLLTCSRVIALIAMVTCLSMKAQAADTTLTLACQGSESPGMKDAKVGKSEPISIGIIINFTNRTVQDLLLPASESVPITDVADLTIDFGGATARGRVYGTIDRVTGDLSATFFWSNVTPATTYWALKCRPAQRMF